MQSENLFSPPKYFFFNLLVRVREPVQEREMRMVKTDASKELIIVTTELLFFTNCESASWRALVS